MVQRRVTVGRVLAVSVFVGMVIFWAMVFAGYFDRKNPDYLKDRSFAARISRQCAATKKTISNLPKAQQARTADDRAGTVDRATELLTAMVGKIEAQPPRDVGSDQRIVRLWIADWRHYLKNRRDYTSALRRDPRARFLVDIKPRTKNDAYDTVVKNFADINNIPSCGPPGDV